MNEPCHISLMPHFPDLARIRQFRERLGLSQRELAVMAGVSQSLIAKIEKGGIDPSYGNIKRIFTAFEKVINQSQMDGKRLAARLTVADIATRGVISISPDETIDQAIDKMVKGPFTQLPVMSGDRVVGSITDDRIRDYAIEETKNGQKAYDDVMKTRVEGVMTDPFPILREDTPVELASLHLQMEEAILVSHKGMIVGILTSADFLKLGLKR